jgi:hypothetical protein
LEQDASNALTIFQPALMLLLVYFKNKLLDFNLQDQLTLLTAHQDQQLTIKLQTLAKPTAKWDVQLAKLIMISVLTALMVSHGILIIPAFQQLLVLKQQVLLFLLSALFS